MASDNRLEDNRSRPSTTETAAHSVPQDGAKSGFFARRKAGKQSPPPPKDLDEKVETGHATVTAAKEEPKVQPASFAQLFRFSTKTELLINAVGLVGAVAAGAAQPLMTLLFGNLTNQFVIFGAALASVGTDPNANQAVAQAAAAFRHVAANDSLYLVFIGIGMLVSTYVYMMTWVYTGEITAKRVREHYLRAVLRQNIAYFDKVGAGEVTTRIQTDTHLVQQGISEKVALVVMFLSSFFTGFILAYIRNWRLALALTSILPCIALTGAVMNRLISRYMQLSLGFVADGGSFAEEVFSTVRTAQAFGTQSTLSRLYDVSITKANVVDRKAAVVNGIGLSLFFFIIYSAYALAFDFGTTLINEGRANAGEVINVFLSILIGSFSLALLAPEMQAVQHARGAAAKLYATIDRTPEIDSADLGGLKLDTVAGDIELEHVDFNYPARPDVQIVKNLNLKFVAGKTAALVGASGSGKSTVISLVERFYDPLAGAVKLDGHDLRELNVKWLRTQIGLVSQEPTLFSTTIRGNIEHGLTNTIYENATPDKKMELVREAAIKANADGFISKLPLGYDTMVGERGFLLSGGQKQRIAIARAVVSDPRILLLDEATSALDTQSEGIVQSALDKAAAGRTTITIAHRLSTIKDADCIYVMGNGVVLEKGRHEELLQNEDGPYAKLVQAQKLREAVGPDVAASDGIDEDDDESTNASGAGDIEKDKDYEKEAAEEVPLGRSNTRQSLASQILEQRRKEREGEKEKNFSLYYLFKRMGYINRAQWKQYLAGALFAILTGAVYPSFGIVFSRAINAFSDSDPHVRRHDGDRNALYFFVIAIVSTITIGHQNYFFSSSAAALTERLRSLSFKAVLRQDIEYFDRDENSTGVLVSNLSDGPQKVNGLAGVTLGTIIQCASTLVLGVVLGLVFIWKLGLVGLACIPLVVSTGYIRLRVVVLKDQANKKAHESSAQLACEAAGAIRTVASLTREDDCLRLYSQSLEQPLQQSNRSAVWSNLMYAVSQSLSFFVIALSFWYGSRLVSFGEFSTFQFFIGLMSTVFGSIQAGNIFAFVPDVSAAQGAASDMIRLMDSVPEVDSESTEGKIPQQPVVGHIKVEDVHFRYPTRPGVRVLRGLNLDIRPGMYVALVGASGCGKSTVIQLVERFYDPLSGRVTLDGTSINEFNVQEYRKHIALVSQEPTLYSGTVRFNVLLGATKPHDQVTEEEIRSACRDANILEFIEGLPQGFDTEVGGKGSQLSGGQKQRIAIARALLRNPRVLLLDEATSALDSNSEKIVQTALDQAAKGRTTIAIAHRLSTIQNADCIYFIKEGVVAEKGTHDELIALRGGYYEYVQLQALSKAS
ncbi:P-loop containing nucleoside triphosphate hydrolase protein [Vararia minispora EC-137]|uniref:P-loop containing nucleoside triphosphate hydrolase protein n=1 Tax=Vararia minispora EC-137 TaxID=1314806 RepID=A0ACB8QK81_9AGAM|nr:P-loop containing nucleoside triphosphate hydrolase protein [Vararia minispora EC-137]